MGLIDWIQHLSIPGGVWILFTLVFALINFKLLPGVWHIRILTPLFRHYLLSSRRPCNPSFLFQPVICSSRAPPLECDYNLHKSNSTYFGDLDIARSQLLCCLFAKFIDTLRKPSKEDQVKGRFSFVLGTVTCHFKREIRPFERYEMWTRVLSWDGKWLYLVTHFVQAGKVAPQRYSLQPWKRPAAMTPRAAKEGEEEGKPHPAIFATSVARYVFKRGRWTIPPETVLRAAELLPAKPDGSDTGGPSSADTTTATHRARTTKMDAAVGSSTPTTSASEAWDWNKIEEERVKGLRLANMVAGLDDLHLEFTAEHGPALAEY